MLPEAFLERMKRQLGDEYESYLDSLNRSRAVALRFNPLKGEIPQLPFVGQPVPWEPMGYYYDPDARPGLHVFHEAGVYYLQEASAMAPVALARSPTRRAGLRPVRRSRRQDHPDRRTDDGAGLFALQ